MLQQQVENKLASKSNLTHLPSAQQCTALLWCVCRLTGVEAMSKVCQAWGSGALYPDIPPALSKINNAGIKVMVGVW